MLKCTPRAYLIYAKAGGDMRLAHTPHTVLTARECGGCASSLSTAVNPSAADGHVRAGCFPIIC